MATVGIFPTTLVLGEDSAAHANERSHSSDAVLPKLGHLVAGKYRIDGILGEGGMGVVAAGHQLNLDRPVAIKFLRQTLGESARQRFTREAMAIAKLENEHVVRVFDAGEERGQPFIVMERLVGNDLADELRLGPLDAEIAIRYLLEACEALAEAHSHGIVHRDLKPSNLFITKGANGRQSVKVLDFGVSKWLDTEPADETPLATGDHGFVGTPAYVSPEQLTTPNAVDERADVWALGVVLYQCLSGKRPFEARGIPQLCAAILSAQPPEFGPELRVPGSLASIVRRSLRKKPEERYQTVKELARALAEFRAPRGRSTRALAALGALPLPTVLVLASAAVIALAVGTRTREPAGSTLGRAAALPLAVVAPPLREMAPEPTHLFASASKPPAPASSGVSASHPRPPEGTRKLRPAKPAPQPSAAASIPPAASNATTAPPEPTGSADAKPLYRR
jgi:serine/threonine-protein kinase